MVKMRSTLAGLAMAVAAVRSVAAQGEPLSFLPPVLPKEYVYNLVQDYQATSKATGLKLNDMHIVGTQYWSLSALSTRGFISSGPGVDKGAPTSALNRVTATNYGDASCYGSLEVNMVEKVCNYYKVEGGSPYDGYDFYRTTVQSVSASGLPVKQENISDWVAFDGVHYGPVNTWAFTPPTGDPKRVLEYTLVYRDGTNELLAYQTAGTEELPNADGNLEEVTMRQTDIRTGYKRVDPTEWAPGFFDTKKVCSFPEAVRFPQGSERNECSATTPPTPSTTKGSATAPPTSPTKKDGGTTGLLVVTLVLTGLSVAAIGMVLSLRCKLRKALLSSAALVEVN